MTTTAFDNELRLKSRLRKNKLFRGIIISFSALTILPIILIILKLVVNGIRQINFSFFTETSPDSLQAMAALANNETIPGGIANGIAGTLIMVFVASVMAVPAGLMIGIYLSGNPKNWYTSIVRSVAEMLQGVPSVVLGIIAYLWIVKNITNGFSSFAGSVAMSVMMLPLIVRSTEETMNMIPREIREAAYALGSPYHRTILQVLIPSGFGGISTGILLSLSRIIGETAPLMMTALGSAFVSIDITRPSSAVPLLIWEFYNDPNMIRLVWSSSLFLMALVLILNITAKMIASKNNPGRQK